MALGAVGAAAAAGFCRRGLAGSRDGETRRGHGGDGRRPRCRGVRAGAAGKRRPGWARAPECARQGALGRSSRGAIYVLCKSHL